MEKQFPSFTMLTDRQLIAQVKTFSAKECEATANLIASLAEFDERRLYLAEGFPSLFAYCVTVLHLTEHAAYNRIEVARTGRQWPIIFQMVADGLVTLTTVRLLSPSLTDANHRELLNAATHKTKREVEELLAARNPQGPVPSVVRKLPAPAAAVPPSIARRDDNFLTPEPAALTPPATARESSAPSPPRRPAVIAPLAPERYKVQMTISRETHDKLRRVQDLLRHQVPDGDPAVVDRALTLLLQDLERKKLACTRSPRPARAATPGSRHIPAAVRRDVWKRDGGQCAFEGHAGRCNERGFIEFHHVVPFADGGPSTVENLQLRCRAHNGYQAEAIFGPLLVRECARHTSRSRASSPTGYYRADDRTGRAYDRLWEDLERGLAVWSDLRGRRAEGARVRWLLLRLTHKGSPHGREVTVHELLGQRIEDDAHRARAHSRGV
jgi:hypothetical protein